MSLDALRRRRRRRRIAGEERGSRGLQGNINVPCERVCATHHAPRRPRRLLEGRHGLAEIVDRGDGVLVECHRVVGTIDPTKVFVTNLSVDAGQGDYLLREHCSSVGEVASVELLMRGYNGTVPTGSAVVQYYSAAAATAAIQNLNGTELDGRRLYVRAYFT